MAYSKNAPFRADVVGSYLRPDELKQARADYAAGIIDAAGLKAVEDRLITDLVAKQKAAGLHVITDGEFRRGWWHFDFMWGFNGVDHVAAAHRVAFHDEVTPADTATVTGKLDGHDHPFVEHFKFIKQFEDDNTVARQTMPSPAQTRFVLTGNKNAYPYDEFYKDDGELTADIVAAYRSSPTCMLPAAVTCSSTIARGPACATRACVSVSAGATKMRLACSRRIST